MQNKHKSQSVAVNTVTSCLCMAKGVSGQANPLTILSIEGQYAAVQPQGKSEHRPIWLPLSVIFQWDAALYERIMRAYNSSDNEAVTTTWRDAKQWVADELWPGMVES